MQINKILERKIFSGWEGLSCFLCSCSHPITRKKGRVGKLTWKTKIGHVLVWKVIWVKASVCNLRGRNDSRLFTCMKTVL